jgi:uncharacterized protein (DUF924 family)
MSLPSEARALLDLWFGVTPEERAAAPRRWFSSDPAFDAQLREAFAPLLVRAAAGGLDDWERTPAGALALVVLLDQVPRNSFRDDPRGFAYDPAAREVCRRALARGADGLLTPEQRLFLYMPLMHSEQAADHAEAMARFEHLAALTAGTEIGPMVANSLDFERKHAAIVLRFGRYPHRNAALGRESTPEEASFLADGRGF